MRVNVQLIDAETGNHLWAERFDKPVADLFFWGWSSPIRQPNRSARSLGLSSIPCLSDGVMLGTAWIDRPVDTRGLRSLLPRPPQRSMEARPCSSRRTTFLSRLCDVPQRPCPDDPKRLTRSRRRSAVGETRKIAAILVSDVVGYSRLTGADEDRTLSRLRGLRSDLVDPAIAAHHGRVVKRTGDGSIIEFRSVVDAVRCAIEVMTGLIERNAGVPPERRIEFRVGIHLGDIVEESDGDLMGDGVNIAARLEGIAEPGGICLSEDAYRQVRDKIKETFVDLGDHSLKNIARPVRVHAIKVGGSALGAHSPTQEKPGPPSLSIVVLPFANIGGDPEQEYFVDGVTESLTTDLSRMPGMLVIGRNTAFAYKGKSGDLKQIGRELNTRYVLEGSVQRGGNRPLPGRRRMPPRGRL
jgi:class 3 adenylate cyclase